MISVPRRKRGGAEILVAVAVIIVSVLLLNIPYFALAPGPTEDVGALIRVEGVDTEPVDGQLLLTTVSLRNVKVGYAIRGWFDSAIAIVSRAAIIPSGESEKDAEVRTTQQMEESQVLAAAAALTYLGYDVQVSPAGVRVREVALDAPAARVLRRGDVIVSADGHEVRSSEELVRQIKQHQVGDLLHLGVRRGAGEVEVDVRTVASPEDPDDPIVGFVIETLPRVELPVAIDITSLGIGGPSAGLMFAVGIVDLIDPDNITGGRIVAGTGAIDLDGAVHAVGGIRQKVEAARRAGAEVFLIPFGELALACDVAGDLKVLGVQTLADAIDALRDPQAARACATG